MKELGLYIHIPFCKSKCAYCNFNSFAGCDEKQPEYLKVLLDEIASKSAPNHVVSTIYIGGGTPSNLIGGGVASIMQAVKSNFSVSPTCEISIEANPNSITYDKVLEWKNAGINRVSVGLQSDNAKLLKLLNRTHTKRDFLNAVKLLKQHGFSNINADIMIGLPTQKLSDVKRTLKTLKRCDIPHVSAYSLIVEDGTPIKALLDDGKIKEPKEIKVLSMYDFVTRELTEWGMPRYEVSNFAKPSFQCRHNQNCWNMVEYLGFGAGAHSFFNCKRFYNYSGIDEYIKSMKSGSAVEVTEKQTTTDLFEEYIMLKLRTSDGIDLDKIKSEYKIDLIKEKGDTINQFVSLNLIKHENNRIFLTYEGFKVLNKIILELVA